jgi:hypothetical protein
VPSFVEVEITADARALADEALAFLEAVVPGYTANPANLEVILIEAIGRMAEQIARPASRMSAAAAARLGESMYRFPRATATRATGAITVNLSSNPTGRTLPEGTLIRVDDVTFETATAVDFGAGTVASTPGSVAIVALDAGTQGNALVGQSVRVAEPMTWVESVSLFGTTSGGTDEQTPEDYLDALRDHLSLSAPRPIVAEDFAAFARSVPGVWRAAAVDNFIPPATYDVARAVAVSMIDETGEAVPSLVRDTVGTLLESSREANFIVSVVDPTYNPIDVIASVAIRRGFDTATALENVRQVIRNIYNPATYGRPFGVESADRVWNDEPTLRWSDLIAAIDFAEGVDFVNLPGTTHRVVGGVHSADDITLDGPFGLPRLNSVTVTAYAP